MLEEPKDWDWEPTSQRRTLSNAVGGLVMILAGVLLLLVLNFGLSSGDAWGYFFVGWGLLVILEGLLRLVVPAFRGRVVNRLVWGVILAGVGLIILGGGDVVRWWPALLILAGVMLLFESLARR